MKATMKHRLDKLEVAEGVGDRRIFIIEGFDGKPMAEAYREAGIEPTAADMVVYLRGFGEAWRGRPARLVSVKHL